MKSLFCPLRSMSICPSTTSLTLYWLAANSYRKLNAFRWGLLRAAEKLNVLLSDIAEHSLYPVSRQIRNRFLYVQWWSILTDHIHLSDSVVRPDYLLRETSGADRWNYFKTDFIGRLHWFTIATDLIARLSRKSDRSRLWARARRVTRPKTRLRSTVKDY